MKKFLICLFAIILIFSFAVNVYALTREERVECEKKEHAKRFEWWPTDARPEPYEDEDRGGYWWWPVAPGEVQPLWGNRGYVYVNKIIFDDAGRPQYIILKILKNVKIYFDFDKAYLRDDALPILEDAVRVLNKNPETTILITGNCDTRGSEDYNLKLGEHRAKAVSNFMIEHGIPEERIRILSRGKLDAVAPITDIVGLQKDRNAQFMVAEVREVTITPEEAEKYPEGSVIEKEQEVTSSVRVEKKEYIIQKNDTLWKIAEREYGKGHRWRYIYEFNKDKIKDPNKLKAGTKIVIPIE